MSNKRAADGLLQQYYNDYRLRLFNYCLTRLHGERENADDCVQEAFIVMYKKLCDGETFENPGAFLYRTADNFVKRQLTQNSAQAKRSVSLDSVQLQDSFEISEEFLSNIDYDKCASLLIAALNDAERELYILRYEKRMSVIDVAQELGISTPAAAKRLSRLREKVREMVETFIPKQGGLAE